MTDHKAEAEKVDNFYAARLTASDEGVIALAQVHATLYLAEQQRIANLIAFVSEWNRGRHSGDNPGAVGRDKVQEAIDQTLVGLGL